MLFFNEGNKGDIIFKGDYNQYLIHSKVIVPLIEKIKKKTFPLFCDLVVLTPKCVR